MFKILTFSSYMLFTRITALSISTRIISIMLELYRYLYKVQANILFFFFSFLLTLNCVAHMRNKICKCSNKYLK